MGVMMWSVTDSDQNLNDISWRAAGIPCELKVEESSTDQPTRSAVQFIGQEQDRHEGERALVMASAHSYRAFQRIPCPGRLEIRRGLRTIDLRVSMLIMLLIGSTRNFAFSATNQITRIFLPSSARTRPKKLFLKFYGLVRPVDQWQLLPARPSCNIL